VPWSRRSSSADNFYKLFTASQRRQWLKIPVAVIGPVTAASVAKWGGKVVVMPKRYTMPDLVQGLTQWVKRDKTLKY
jgi:uroporphyrinogen-III synthase